MIMHLQFQHALFLLGDGFTTWIICRSDAWSQGGCAGHVIQDAGGRSTVTFDHTSVTLMSVAPRRPSLVFAWFLPSREQHHKLRHAVKGCVHVALGGWVKCKLHESLALRYYYVWSHLDYDSTIQ